MPSDPVEAVKVSEEGEVLQISKSTADAVDRLRMFYRNNKGQEITRDRAIRWAADLSLSYGQRIVGTADGTRPRVRG